MGVCSTARKGLAPIGYWKDLVRCCGRPAAIMLRAAACASCSCILLAHVTGDRPLAAPSDSRDQGHCMIVLAETDGGDNAWYDLRRGTRESFPDG